MKLNQLAEARYSAPPVEIKKLEKLLDAVAQSIAFIGYGSRDAGRLAGNVKEAFEEAVGMPYYEWKKRKR